VNDGTERWVATRGLATFDNGNTVAFFGIALDITERKRADQAREVLIAELQHRTRNLLAVVSSIAAETIASSNSMREFGQAFNNRLSSLSRVQGLLSRGEDNVATISRLVHLELGALGAEPDGKRVIVEGPEVHLPTKSVQILALALHELATNARKYGALTAPNGQLSVFWKVLTEGRNRMLELEWHETGLAPRWENAGPPHIGFGRTLIEESLPFQLDAQTKLIIDRNEVHCTITLALTDQMAPRHG
jgi:two-component system CheB/CheR fusion protein